MDGVHDMGGMHGFGAVVEPDGDLPYHERWEPRAFAIQMLVNLEGLGAGPGGRPVREEMDPAHYLTASYYERWIFSAERRLARKGTTTDGDVELMIDRLASGEPAPQHHDVEMGARAVQRLRARSPMRPPPDDARFAPGDPVRVRRMHPPGHTRCPRYARGATGVVERVHGADRLPDLAVYGEQAEPEAVYAVAFASHDLWGPGTEPPWTVMVDLWDSYLDPA